MIKNLCDCCGEVIKPRKLFRHGRGTGPFETIRKIEYQNTGDGAIYDRIERGELCYECYVKFKKFVNPNYVDPSSNVSREQVYEAYTNLTTYITVAKASDSPCYTWLEKALKNLEVALYGEELKG